MSSISSTLPASGPLVPQNEPRIAAAAADAAQSAQAVAYKPQWLVPTPGTTRGFEILGLNAPSSSADVATLIAQVSLSLEVSVDEGRKKDAVARLAALAAALTSVDTTTAEATMFRKIDSETRTKTTKTDLDAKADALVQKRSAAATPEAKAAVDVEIQQLRLSGLDQQIIDLRADLAAAPAGSAEADAIGADIAALTTRRSAVASSLSASQSSIATHRADVTSWQRKIDTEKAKTTPEDKLIATYTASRDTSQAALTKAYETLHSNASTGLAGDRKSLGDLLATKTAASAAATSALQGLVAAATAIARLAAAQYGAERQGEDLTNKQRDGGIETEFQDIFVELEAATGRLDDIKGKLASELSANEGHANERASNVALSIVAALASVVSTLSSSAEVSAQQDTASRPRQRVVIEA